MQHTRHWHAPYVVTQQTPVPLGRDMLSRKIRPTPCNGTFRSCQAPSEIRNQRASNKGKNNSRSRGREKSICRTACVAVLRGSARQWRNAPTKMRAIPGAKILARRHRRECHRKRSACLKIDQSRRERRTQKAHSPQGHPCPANPVLEMAPE